MTRRGWSSAGLPVVGDDEALWTAENAATLLGGGEVSAAAMRRLLRERGVAPVGKRRVTAPSRAGGRHARVYRAADVIEALEARHHEAAVPEVGTAAS